MMFIETYHSLIDALCAECKIPDPVGMYGVADFDVRGVHFSLFYGDAVAPGSALLYADFGELTLPDKPLALQRLMEINLYLFGAFAPSFCFNPQTQKILLVCLLPLEGNTATKVLALFGHLANMAADWRTDHYLTDNEKRDGVLHRDGGAAERVAGLLSHLFSMLPPDMPAGTESAEAAWTFAQENETDIQRALRDVRMQDSTHASAFRP